MNVTEVINYENRKWKSFMILMIAMISMIVMTAMIAKIVMMGIMIVIIITWSQKVSWNCDKINDLDNESNDKELDLRKSYEDGMKLVATAVKNLIP